MIKKIVKFMCTVIFLSVVASVAPAYDKNYSRELIPIVNENMDEKEISATYLKLIFTMRVTRWADGTPITVFILPQNNILQRKFLWETFGLTPSMYRDVFAARQAAGIKLPTVIETQSMIGAVRSTPGSIGLLENNVVINVNRGVRFFPIAN